LKTNFSDQLLKTYYLFIQIGIHMSNGKK